jgi:hypothetical protein
VLFPRCGGGQERRDEKDQQQTECADRMPESVHAVIETHSAAFAQATPLYFVNMTGTV